MKDGVRSFAGFRRLWGARTVSMVGDQVTLVALPLVAVLELGAGPAQMGFVTAAGQLPLLVFGLLAGAVADRVRRRGLLVGCDLARAGLVALVPLAVALDALSIPLLGAIVFAVATLGVFFETAATATLPELVPRVRLVDANARLAGPRAVAQIAGPGVAGALVQAITALVAMVADAVSYLGSAAFLARLPRPTEPTTQPTEPTLPIEPREPAPTPSTRSRNGVRGIPGSIALGLAYAWRHPVLRASGASAGTYNLFHAAVLATQILYATRALGLAPTELGLFLAAVGPGVPLGAMVAVPVGRRLGLGTTLIAGLVAAGLTTLAIPLAGGPRTLVVGTLLAAMAVNGFGQSLYNINQSAIRQAVVPAELQGRVQATLTVLAGGAAPLGALAGGALGAAIGIRPTLLVAGIGTVGAAGWLIVSPVRRIRSLQDLTGLAARADHRTAAESLSPKGNRAR